MVEEISGSNVSKWKILKFKNGHFSQKRSISPAIIAGSLESAN